MPSIYLMDYAKDDLKIEGDKIMTVGRYMGKTFEDVRRTDISYCNWVLKQVKPGGAIKNFQEYLKGISHFATCERCNGSGKVHIM